MASRLVVDKGQVQALMAGANGAVARDMLRRGRNVANAAKRLAPVDTGRLRADISVGLVDGSSTPIVRVGNSVNYAMAVHEGTGVYGPKGRPIRPRRAKVLRFKGKGGKVIFARSVRGTRGRPYLRDALPAAAK